MPQIVVENLRKSVRVAERAPGLWGAVRGLALRTYRTVEAVRGIYFSLDPRQVASVGESLLFGCVALGSFGALSAEIVALGRIRPLLSRLPERWTDYAGRVTGRTKRWRKDAGRASRLR